MNIKISGLRSGLNYNDMLNPITGGFIRDIAEKLGCTLAMTKDLRLDTHFESGTGNSDQRLS